jgi:hypothetical protein
MQYWQKKTEALPFEDRNFKMAASGLPFETVKNGIPVNFLKFLGNKIMYWPTRSTDYQIDPYDTILNIGFRTKSLVLGVTVPYWNGVNTPVMLFEIMLQKSLPLISLFGHKLYLF